MTTVVLVRLVSGASCPVLGHFQRCPLGFWRDTNNEKYDAAYFETFPGIWHHGDFIERTASGGYIIHGRSDATLNPAVFGSAR